MNAPVKERVQHAEEVPQQQQEVRSVVVRREAIPVESSTPVLDTAMFDHMMRIAKLMASSGLVPQHLNAIRMVERREVAIEQSEAIANCFLVVNQAVHWKMDPFAVAQHTFVHKGKIGYEGKLIASVINTHPALVKRLSYEYSGEGMKRKVVVTAQTSGDPVPRSIEGTYENWLTKEKDGGINASWSKNTDQMLAYRGAREWARRWLPEAILGVWSDDEIQFEYGSPQSISETTKEPQRGAAGLKDAMEKARVVSSATVDQPPINAGDAESRSESQGTAPAPADAAARSASPAPAEAKPAGDGKPDHRETGTADLRDKFVAKMKACADAAVLGAVMDETRMYQWFDLDAATLTETYLKRQGELS